MFFITIIRIVIWATFFLLIIEGVAAIIWARYFYMFYVREHAKLALRVQECERCLGITDTKEPRT